MSKLHATANICVAVEGYNTTIHTYALKCLLITSLTYSCTVTDSLPAVEKKLPTPTIQCTSAVLHNMEIADDPTDLGGLHAWLDYHDRRTSQNNFPPLNPGGVSNTRPERK